MTRQLVLLGSGPAHLRLLALLAKRGLQGEWGGAKITLISRNQRHIDARLLSEFVAGRLTLEACSVDLEPPVQKTRIQWIEAQAVALDAKAQALLLADGQEIRYDWLSINQEPLQSRAHAELQMPGAQANGLFVRPTSVFCKLWPGVLALAATKPLRVAVVCDNHGAATTGQDAILRQQEVAGIELAMAIHHALPGCSVTLITGGAPLASASTVSMRQVLARTLKAKRITVLEDAATAIKQAEVTLASGASLACDVPVLAVNAHPPAFAVASGLALDANGFIAIDAALRSISHANVFSTPGTDIADNLLARTLGSVAGLPALGVAGLPASGLSDRGTKAFGGLQFVSSNDGQAIVNWGGYSARGRILAWLKHSIDQSRMTSYTA